MVSNASNIPLYGKEPSKTGAGIVAIKSNVMQNQPTGSHLALLTTSEEGSSQERLRINASGEVSIGTSNGTAKLNVKGTGLVTNLNLDNTKILNVSKIENNENITINATVEIKGETTVSADLKIAEALYLKGVTPKTKSTQ